MYILGMQTKIFPDQWLIALDFRRTSKYTPKLRNSWFDYSAYTLILTARGIQLWLYACCGIFMLQWICSVICKAVKISETQPCTIAYKSDRSTSRISSCHFWLSLDLICFMHVGFRIQDLPIVFMDGSLPVSIMAKEAEARFIGYLWVSFSFMHSAERLGLTF